MGQIMSDTSHSVWVSIINIYCFSYPSFQPDVVLLCYSLWMATLNPSGDSRFTSPGTFPIFNSDLFSFQIIKESTTEHKDIPWTLHLSSFILRLLTDAQRCILLFILTPYHLVFVIPSSFAASFVFLINPSITTNDNLVFETLTLCSPVIINEVWCILVWKQGGKGFPFSCFEGDVEMLSSNM